MLRHGAGMTERRRNDKEKAGMPKSKQPIEPATGELGAKGKAAKAASRRLAYLSTDIKNRALANIADDIIARKSEILVANQIDYNEAKTSGMNEAMLDRLLLNTSRP